MSMFFGLLEGVWHTSFPVIPDMNEKRAVRVHSRKFIIAQPQPRKKGDWMFFRASLNYWDDDGLVFSTSDTTFSGNDNVYDRELSVLNWGREHYQWLLLPVPIFKEA